MDAETVRRYSMLHIATDDGRPVGAAPHHSLWLNLLCDERIKRLLIIAPPESAKTTWAVMAYLGCRIGFWPEQNIILACASGGPATERSQALRMATQAPMWRKTFPHIERAEGMRWSDDRWSLAPDGRAVPGRLHPTVSAYGTGGSIAGARADLVLADDLLDEDNTRTAFQRDSIMRWFERSLLSRLKARVGRAIVIGTAWHHDDVYARIRRSGRWVVCHVPLLSESERVFADVTYPDDWPYPMLGEPMADIEAA